MLAALALLLEAAALLFAAIAPVGTVAALAVLLSTTLALVASVAFRAFSPLLTPLRRPFAICGGRSSGFSFLVGFLLAVPRGFAG
jgi:hypothetical protein